MRVLLSAYFCHPSKGSEQGVGWNWLRELAKCNEVWALIYAGQGQAEAVRRAVSELPYAGHIHLIPIKVAPAFQNRFYHIRYELWQREAFKLSRLIVETEHIELIHHVTIAAWWNCGHLWKLGVPFVFGPISGAQRTPRSAFSFLRLKEQLTELGREFLFEIAWRSWRRPQLAIKKADLVLVTNLETERRVRAVWPNKRVEVVTVVGANIPSVPIEYRRHAHSDAIDLLWSGRLVPTKNFALLLEALLNVPGNIPWYLHIAGEGPLLDYWKGRCVAAGLEQRVTFLGRIDHSRMGEEYARADIFVFPSLREGTATVIMEAMSYGLPVVALDHHGANVVLDDTCGILVPVIDREQMVRDLRDAIVRLCKDESLRRKLGRMARQKIVSSYSWEKRGARMNELYSEVLEHPDHLLP